MALAVCRAAALAMVFAATPLAGMAVRAAGDELHAASEDGRGRQAAGGRGEELAGGALEPVGAPLAPTGPAVVALVVLVAAAAAYARLRGPDRLAVELAAERRRTAAVRRRLADEIELRRRAERRLGRTALRDVSTGLPNRAWFMHRLGEALARARRRQVHAIAVVLADIDRFLAVNDSLGHTAGDRLLHLAARRFRRCVRRRGAVARLGGDEFALLLDPADEAVATATAERVREAFLTPFVVAGQEVFLTLSLGTAVGGPQLDGPEALLREADRAMDRAKARRRGRAVRLEPPATGRAVSALELDRDLRRAIDRDELVPYFQPIVELAGGRLAGFEVLVRWPHRVAGLLAPGEFVGLAEQTGLIVAIDRSMLRSACERAREWLDRGAADFFLSVNLSGPDLRQPDLLDFVAGTLAATRLPAGVLRVEVTEGVILGNEAATTELIEGLGALGVPLLLDDFGTGYASLSYLHRYPFDYLKIDRSFTGGLPVDGRDEGIVRSLVRLAGDLGMRTVAEGVETGAVRDRLTALGCDFGQGFLFAEAQPAEVAAEMAVAGRCWTDRLADCQSK